MERLREDLKDVVIGRVMQADRHPNADTLWVTKVDDGSGELLDVVCGAPVVTVGTLYPFARAGITLPGGIKLEKRKIRGEISNGMLCSARELGLGADHAGIMALDIDVAPGTPFLRGRQRRRRALRRRRPAEPARPAVACRHRARGGGADGRRARTCLTSCRTCRGCRCRLRCTTSARRRAAGSPSGSRTRRAARSTSASSSAA